MLFNFFIFCRKHDFPYLIMQQIAFNRVTLNQHNYEETLF